MAFISNRATTTATTDFYIHFLILSRANQITLPPAVEEALILLLDHLMYITRPDGTTPFFGDDDGGRLAMLDTRGPTTFARHSQLARPCSLAAITSS